MDVSTINPSNALISVKPLDDLVSNRMVEKIALRCLSFLGHVLLRATLAVLVFNNCRAIVKLAAGKDAFPTTLLTCVFLFMAYSIQSGTNMADARLVKIDEEFEKAFYGQAALVQTPQETLALFKKYGHRLKNLDLSSRQFVAVLPFNRCLSDLATKPAGFENVYIDLDYDDELHEIIKADDYQQQVQNLIKKQEESRTNRILFDYNDLCQIFDSCPNLKTAEVKSDWTNVADLNKLWSLKKSLDVKFVN